MTSRIEDVEGFVEAIRSLGFKLESKVSRLGCSRHQLKFSQDDSNTHFLVLEFVKRKRAQILSEAGIQNLQIKHDLLKPCEYKRR